MKTLLIAAGIALALTLHAAPQIGRGTPPGSNAYDPWPTLTKEGYRVVYGLMETRNGVSAVTFGWYSDAPKICGLHEQETLRNASNWWDRLLGRYKAEMVWIVLKPGESTPGQVGGNPLAIY